MSAKAKWLTPDGLVELLRAGVSHDGGQRPLAKRLGVSPQYLCDVLAKRREPGKKLCAALGVRRVVIYEIDGA